MSQSRPAAWEAESQSMDEEPATGCTDSQAADDNSAQSAAAKGEYENKI